MNNRPQNPFDMIPTPDETRFSPQGQPTSPFPHQPPFTPPPQNKKLTPKAIIAIVITLVIICAAILGAIVVLANRESTPEPDLAPGAETVAAKYLDAVIARDKSTMRKLQSANVSEPDPDERFVGNERAAQSVDLTMSYSIIKTEYRAEPEDAVQGYDPLDSATQAVAQKEATLAVVFVTMGYDLTVRDKLVHTWVEQAIVLTRYDVIDLEPKPIGPWMVDRITDTVTATLDKSTISDTAIVVGSDYQPPAATASCNSPQEIVQLISESTELNNVIPAACAAGHEKFDQLDSALVVYLEENLTALKPENMTELLGISLPESHIDNVDEPVAQILFTVNGRKAIFTFVLLNPNRMETDTKDKYRLVSIIEKPKY